MDRLIQYFSHTIEVFDNNLKSGEPTSAQLTSFLQGVGKEVNRLTTSAPKRIQIICVNGFIRFSWDLKLGKPVKSTNNANLSSVFGGRIALSGLKDLVCELQNWTPPIDPTHDELTDISKACEKLWDLDIHRLQPSRDYSINVQGGKAIYDSSDRAKLPLFSFVDEAKVFETPTFKAFIALLDNYSARQGVKEIVSAEELRENERFLSLVCDTACMQYVQSYLATKGIIPVGNRESFVALLNQAWFGLYRRVVDDDTSGFEHVFIGEIDRNGDVSGLHNWIQLYLEEKKNALDYLGYIKPKRNVKLGNDSAPSDHQQLITIQFSWNGCIKKCSSSFIGTSPEFEIALFTLIFFASPEEKTIVKCGPYKVEVSAFKMRCKGKNFIGSSFPSEAPLDEHEAATKIQNVYRGNQSRQRVDQLKSRR